MARRANCDLDDHDRPMIIRACIDSTARFLFLFSESDGGATTFLVESGGAVCWSFGCTAPTTCLLTSVPAKLRRHAQMVVEFICCLVDMVQAVVHQPIDSSFRDGWIDDWAQLVMKMMDSPLYWEPDSVVIAFSWARSAAVHACPVVPGAALHYDRIRAHTVTPWQASLSAMRDAQPSTALMSRGHSRMPAQGSAAPVLLWTPEFFAFLTDGSDCPTVVTGFAWRASAAGNGHADPAVPHLQVYEWSAGGDSFFTYTRLPRPFMQDGSSAPSCDMDGRDMTVRRLLAAAGHVDARAAHAPSVRLAVSHASLPSSASLARIDPCDGVESRLGAGPHTFALHAVPAMSAGGALTRAALAASRLACTGQDAREQVGRRNPHAPPILNASHWSRSASQCGSHEALDVDENVSQGNPWPQPCITHAEQQAERSFRLESARLAADRMTRAGALMLRQMNISLEAAAGI